MILLRRSLAVTLLVLLVASAAFAQGTTGTLTGVVTTEGNPLPGVTVTISSPALQGTRSTVTNENGGYNFPNVPPGDYSAKFELSGLQTQTRKVKVSLAQTSGLDVAMRVSSVAEAITVTAQAPAVLETAQVSTNFTKKQIDNLPTTRTIASTVSLAPGVHDGIAGNAIQGAPSYDNVYLVNGVVVNENLRGQPHSLFIEDAIQETTIMTDGISAEYGRFTGGVISTITKSGGNVFSGSFRDNVTNPSWQKKTPWPGQPNPVDKTNNVYEATLGGFFIKDRLWFFGAGRKAKTSDQRFTTITNIPFVHGIDEKRYEGKLTGQITPKHSVVASYLDIKNTELNNAFGTILDTNSLVPTRQLPNSLLSLNYNGIVTSNLLVEAQYSRKKFAFVNSGARSTDRVFGTLLIQLPGFRRFWSPTFCGVCTPEERNNKSWLAKANYYLGTPGLGSHNIVGGVENYAEERIANNHQSGSDYRIFGPAKIVDGVPYPVFNSQTEIVWTPIFLSSPGTDFQTRSAFVNDKWDLNSHWSFNIGLRYDKNNGHDADGHLISDDSAFSPRLGLMYDPRGDGRHRVYANYARYVSKIADGNVGGSSQAAGNPGFIGWEYAGPPINVSGPLVSTEQALRQLWAWFDSVGGTNNKDFLVESFVPGFSSIFLGSIGSPRVDEKTLGYGWQIRQNAYVRADAVVRDWHNFYAARIDKTTPQTTDPFGNKADLAVTINNGSIKRTYRALVLQGSWNPGRFNFGGNYTWSKLRGNDTGESGPAATVRNLPLSTYYPEILGYAQRLPIGFLPEDVRNRARVWAGYTVRPWVGSLNISLLESYQSGSPYSAIGTIDASGRNTPFAGSPDLKKFPYTYSALGTSHTYFFSARGAFRTDAVSSTDLALNYSFPIRMVELFVRGDVLNIFNNAAVVNPNTTVITRRSGGASSGLKAFNPFTDTPVEGVNWKKGSSFGKPTGPTSYQDPRFYRFAVGLRF